MQIRLTFARKRVGQKEDETEHEQGQKFRSGHIIKDDLCVLVLIMYGNGDKI